MDSTLGSETFIPQSRQQLIDLCIGEGHLSAADTERFCEFCSLLAAYYHVRFYKIEEALKINYLPFNPDGDSSTQQIQNSAHTKERLTQMENVFIETLTSTLQRANFRSLDWVAIQQALEKIDLVDLKTEISFSDFDQLLLFFRGTEKEIGIRSKLLWKTRVPLRLFSHVILCIKFKEAAHFQAKKIKLEELNFRPGQMYLYLYKDIPENDLELLFPNVQIGMSWFDRILFFVPAAGAAISVVIKIVPNLLLLLGVLLFFTLGPSVSERVGVSESQIHNASPVLLALMSVLFALGAFAYRQYDAYKNKRIKFLKMVAETLFFKSVANNASVFHSVIDSAEEEECKELLLIYYLVLVNNGKITVEQLRQQVQLWLKERCGMLNTLEIEPLIVELSQLEAQIIPPGAITPRSVSLFSLDANSQCQVPSPIVAKAVLSQLWAQAVKQD